MSYSIMHDLYFGKLRPWERGRPDDPNYTPLTRKSGEIKEQLNNTLSSEEKELLDEMQKFEVQHRTIEEIHLFEYAFCMGALTMIDVFDFKQRIITNLKEQ